MLSREQAQSLTRTIHLLRPGWNEEGIYAALAQVKGLDPFEVALAALRAAKDPNAKTPGVIPSKGPHWNEEPPSAPAKQHLSRDERRSRTCATCGFVDGCRGGSHDFVPLTQATSGRTTAPADLRANLHQSTAQRCSHGIRVTHCSFHRQALVTEPSEETA